MKKNIVKSGDSNISKVAYYIGGFIVVLGIIAFIIEQWNAWGELFRSLVILVPGILIYTLAYLKLNGDRLKSIKNICFISSYFLIGGGIYFLMKFTGLVSAYETLNLALLSSMLFLFSVASYKKTKNIVFYALSFLSFFSLIFNFCLYSNQELGVSRGWSVLIYGIFVILLKETNDRVIGTKSGLNKFFGFFGPILYCLGLFELVGDISYVSLLLFIPVFIYAMIIQNRDLFIFLSVFMAGSAIYLMQSYMSSIGLSLTLIITGLFIICLAYFDYKIIKEFKKK